MIPVTQTSFYDPDAPPNEQRGNCLTAVVASLLELPIEDVPDFVQEHVDRLGSRDTPETAASEWNWWNHLHRFLAERYKYGDVQAAKPIREQAAWGEGWINPQGYRRHSQVGHPTSNAHGHVFDHRVVLYDAIGGGEHSCHWCGTTVAWEITQRVGGLEVDHVDGDKLNNDVSNLVPSCTSCNSRRRHDGNPTTWKAA